MSEYTEESNEMNESTIVEETEVEAVAIESEDIEPETAEELAEEVDASEAEQVEEKPVDIDEVLFDKIQRAARLLRARKAAMAREAEEDAARVNDLLRALKLLELKPEMEQKEMSDLLGMRLRELDSLLRQAEEAGAVTRVMPEEEDMRAVLVSATENAEEYAAAMGNKRKKLVAQLSSIDAEDIIALMDKIIDPLTEMGLDNDDRGARGGFGDRGGRGGFGGRGGDRGPRRDFGGRGGDRGPRRDDRGPRRDFGDRGPRKDFGDRGPRRDDRGPRRDFGDRGGRGGFGGRDDRGGRGGYGDRGGRGGYGDRRGGSRY